MQNIIFFLKKYIKDTIIVILVITCIGLVYLVFDKNEVYQDDSNSVAILEKESEKDSSEQYVETIYVDVKGSVKKPGVYEVKNNNIVNDVITMAGGFTSTAYKNNINLSKKVSNEMVIYVYSKTEYKKQSTNLSSNIESNNICQTPTYDISNCVDNKISVIENGTSSVIDQNKKDDEEKNNSSQTELVNINTADVNVLTSLSGIGEAKAKTIIEYRNKNGNFKSIDDIMSVSGIGESLFDKIKDYITI